MALVKKGRLGDTSLINLLKSYIQLRTSDPSIGICMKQNLIDNLWQETLVFEFDTDYKLTIGAVELYVKSLKNEWQFSYRYITGDETKNEKEVLISTLKDLRKDGLELMRFVRDDDDNAIQIRPRLANKNIVAKPYMPLFLPSQQTVTIYISTPVWLAIFQNQQSRPLMELPTFILSDSWFGPTPHIGELCYASLFSGRIDLSSLPRRASRIITPVTITNNGIDNLKLEKISIPCDYLAIYANSANELWTPTLSIVRETDQSKTRMSIDKKLHPKLLDAKRIAEPRVLDQTGLLSKTIDMLFS